MNPKHNKSVPLQAARTRALRVVELQQARGVVAVLLRGEVLEVALDARGEGPCAAAARCGILNMNKTKHIKQRRFCRGAVWHPNP